MTRPGRSAPTCAGREHKGPGASGLRCMTLNLIGTNLLMGGFVIFYLFLKVSFPHRGLEEKMSAAALLDAVFEPVLMIDGQRMLCGP